jgi:hypothetical protein
MLNQSDSECNDGFACCHKNLWKTQVGTQNLAVKEAVVFWKKRTKKL